MGRTSTMMVSSCPRAYAWTAAFLLVFFFAPETPVARAAATGKIQGKIVSADTGEPIGYADILLLPADTTLRRVGTLTNADGTYLLEASPGRYTLQVRALSYATQRIEGVDVAAGHLLPLSAALTTRAIQVKEVEVQARGRHDTESAMLATRRKAVALGDAVSAEQVRRSPDKDAAEVLKRVTGLSVSGGKYVFVRGLGERYSSTELDGVRIATPEQNKRVIPLDLIPANLIDNVVIQKTYTADRPGEFGGGDVQLHTKDFPGRRTWSFTASQGYAERSTFKERLTYAGGKRDLFGFGADARRIPDAVFALAGDRPLDGSHFTAAQLAGVARSFSNVWSPTTARTLPNASYSATYGDEFKLFGRPLGLIESWSLSRSYRQQEESQRFFESASDTLYDYAVRRSTESAQMGGLTGLSYRISPSHSLHLRGFYTKSADDEVRTYEGPDHNQTETTTGGWLVHRGTRLMYVERNVMSAALEGNHRLARLFGAQLDWKLGRSRARRLQPDRRETVYDHRYEDDGNGGLLDYWSLGSQGRREYGDLHDNGWGTTVSGSLPYKLRGFGAGKLALGYDRQTKERNNYYRRIDITRRILTYDPTDPPEKIFDPGAFTNPVNGGAAEATQRALDPDNYRANQKVAATYLSADVPFGKRARGNFGVRRETGFQNVVSFDLFREVPVDSKGKLDNTDWLPSGNLTLSLSEAANLRLAASRTVSRPDLNELSPSPSIEYKGGLKVQGNPFLQRARIDNYDLRFETFPGAASVVAAGAYLKHLHQPIEQVVQGGSPNILVPRNSDYGINRGVELELRSGLERISPRLRGLSINTNATFISSRVKLNSQISKLGSQEHPLQGQANYMVNAALSYASKNGGTEMSILLGATGRRLVALGVAPLPDVYEQPSTSLDVTAGIALFRGSRVKLGARNLLDPRIQQLQRGNEVSGFRTGRSYSLACSWAR